MFEHELKQFNRHVTKFNLLFRTNMHKILLQSTETMIYE
jgi:hypothetical protein